MYLQYVCNYAVVWENNIINLSRLFMGDDALLYSILLYISWRLNAFCLNDAELPGQLLVIQYIKTDTKQVKIKLCKHYPTSFYRYNDLLRLGSYNTMYCNLCTVKICTKLGSPSISHVTWRNVNCMKDNQQNDCSCPHKNNIRAGNISPIWEIYWTCIQRNNSC